VNGVLRTFVHIVALAICGLSPSLALAWGEAGHHIVCEIAWQELDAKTRDTVRELLAGDVDRTFAKSCSWADRVLRRRDPSFDRYHYVNVPEGAERVPPCEGKCVVEGIEEFALVLGDLGAPRRDRVLALKLVGHLVGDIHQPLHAGYASDRGGNDVPVELLGRKTNLHAAWDTGLLQSLGRDWQAQARELASGIRAGDRRLWRGSPRDWAEESFALVDGPVYEGIPALGDAYVAWARPVLEERLQAAGVRLAALLRRTLTGDAPRRAKAPPRLRLISAQLGLLESTAAGGVAIRETTEIPRVPGATFGWILTFDSLDREVAWREELVLSAPPLHAGDAKQVSPRKLVREGRARLEQGRLAQQWTLDAGDPIGAHRIRVYVDGRLAKSFRFSTYLPQAATPSPPPGTAASPGACIPRAQCCKVCSTGQACGATCISRSYTCRTGQGCACDAAEICR
jgi:nuclease S1